MDRGKKIKIEKYIEKERGNGRGRDGQSQLRGRDMVENDGN